MLAEQVCKKWCIKWAKHLKIYKAALLLHFVRPYTTMSPVFALPYGPEKVPSRLKHPAIHFIFCFLLLSACARQIPPTGGPRDEQPPALDTLHSTRNFSTQFSGKRIELTFDEWVTLQDAATQVTISPPLAYRPSITLKGKTVRVELDEREVLRPNTTYTIRFGDAIKDLHEGNAAKDLRFVFATGAVIDSLRIGGVVADAFTGELSEKVLVALYDDFRDSAARRERPYYVTRTDKNGQFTIENVRSGRFRLLAFEDANQNFRWDGEGERIAFYPKPLHSDSAENAIISLRLFRDQETLRLRDKQANTYGVVRLTYSSPPEGVKVRALTAGIPLQTEISLDTLLVWYHLPEGIATPTWQLLVGEKDTVTVRTATRAAFLQRRQMRFYDPAPTVAQQQRGRSSTEPNAPPRSPAAYQKQVALVERQQPVVLTFNAPVAAFDTARWQMWEDSLRSRGLRVRRDSVSVRTLQATAPWRGTKSARLLLLPGAVTDMYGVVNTDTLRIEVTLTPEKQLGTLMLTAQLLKPKQAYFVQLLNGSNVAVERRFVATSSTQKFTIPKLLPTEYTLRLVEDNNGNGRWDSGSFFEGRQPERIFSKKLESLRANWDLEASIRAE